MKIKIKILLLVLQFFIYNTLIAQFKGDAVFSDVLHTIHIVSQTEPNLLQLLEEDRDQGIKPYHKVNVIFDNDTIKNVGVRVKGYFSLNADPMPLKLDFNEYIDTLNFDGLKKLNLNNSFTDDYKLRDRFSLALMKRVGIPSPRTAYAEVYINDVFHNLSVIIEQVDKTFLKENFATNNGTLKKNFDIIFGNSDVLGNISEDEIFEKVHQRNFFKYLLTNIIVDNGDTYPINNFYIFYNSKDDHFHFIPWDYNFAVYNPLLNPIVGSLFPVVHANKWNDPDIRALYLDVACELSHYMMDEEYITNLITTSKEIIDSNTQNITVLDHTDFITYFQNRQQWLVDKLAEENFNCNGLNNPLEEGDLVINEFVANSDENGEQDPNGQNEDWIELYNNSDEEITLDYKYFLSNDKDTPKKWNFKNPITIQPDSYQIVWADRDIDEEGLHVNFKIKANGGDLLLTYADLDPIQNISYDEQIVNQGNARVPNGTGGFSIQMPTFNDNNDNAVGINRIDKDILKISPNPVSESFFINADILINKVEIFNMQGQMIFENFNPNNKIEIGDFKPGILLLKIYTDDFIFNTKLIKL